MSTLGFKAREDPALACFVAFIQWIPRIQLWCNSCWPLGSQQAVELFDPHKFTCICEQARDPNGDLVSCWMSHPDWVTVRKRKGNVFTSVCQEFCPERGCLPHCMLRYTHLWTHPCGHTHTRDGHCSGRYTSYRNGFLFLKILCIGKNIPYKKKFLKH